MNPVFVEQQLNTRGIALSKINIILFCILLTVVRLIDISNLKSFTIIIIFSLLVFLMLKAEDEAVCLFFSIPLTDDLGLSSIGLSYMMILELVFILKSLYKFKFQMNKLILCLLIALFQMITVFVMSNSIVNIFSMLVNFFLLMILFDLFKNNNEYLEQAVLLFALGVAAACVSGLVNDSREYEWIRFAGVWNDENFAGMYCLLAGISILTIKKFKLWRMFYIVPFTSLYLYTATLSLSRTFVITLSLIMAFYAFHSLIRSKIKIINKLLLIFLIAAMAYSIYMFSFASIIDSRGLISTNSADFTNNRLTYTENAFRCWKNSTIDMLFGFGFNNTINRVEYFGMPARATHNTYVDILFEFGMIGFVPLIIFFYLYLKKYHLSSGHLLYFNDLMLMVIVIYATALSLLKYDFLYMMLALICAKSSIETEIIERKKL